MMPDMDGFLTLSVTMKAQGIRRLLVLSGEANWSYQQAEKLRESLGEDGLFISPDPQPEPWCMPSALKILLGREFEHAFFDARRGFDVAALAVLAGTLKAGSWLVLLVPDFNRWPTQADADSVRWSDSVEPIPTPHFIHHFCQILQRDAEALIWQQHQPFTLPEFQVRPPWHVANGEPQAEQADILTALKNLPPGVAVVTAERGRGKSALAGMHLKTLSGDAIVTAPAKAATDVLAHFAGDPFCFMAPDALLASTAQAEWLIVDEAAAIPGPLLERLVNRFPRTLLTTTVQGYEGTGRGFLLKFCARFPRLTSFTLTQPVRWANGCPLDAFISAVLLFDDVLPTLLPKAGPLRVQRVEQDAWSSDPTLPTAMYRLLCAAHYRTSPLDLRRMMDAPGQHFISMQEGDNLIGALWQVEEGGLSPALSDAVWAGFRRPRGNLVAQSLAAHGGSPQAATLRSQRISRIAVHPQRQRQGIGLRMIQNVIAQTRDCDYLSVSFGFTDELWRFWQRCGFRLVRLGTYREASSGCYTAMAIYPLTEPGVQLAKREQARFERDAFWQAAWRDDEGPSANLPSETILTEDDWQELAGFAFAHRPLMAAVGSLNRLLATVNLPLPTLRNVLQSQTGTAAGTGGRKAQLVMQRQETAAALAFLDANRCQMLAAQVKNLQFF